MMTRGKVKYLPKEERPRVKQVIKWCKQIFEQIEDVEILNGKISISVSGIKFEFFIKDESMLINGMYIIINPSSTQLIITKDKEYFFEKEDFKKGLKEIVDLIEKASDKKIGLVI